jgi:hypothetical protein
VYSYDLCYSRKYGTKFDSVDFWRVVIWHVSLLITFNSTYSWPLQPKDIWHFDTLT